MRCSHPRSLAPLSPFSRSISAMLVGVITSLLMLPPLADQLSAAPETGKSAVAMESDASQDDEQDREAPRRIPQDEDPDNPFPTRIDVDYEFPRDSEWLNTGGAIRMRDLQGKFVLFDFWTYCCINCIHVLPTLAKIEEKYADQIVVIGVHSAKFDAEQDSDNITEAILRYKIAHPVINDFDHRIWNSFGVRSWPTMLMFDPEGNAVWMRSGEVTFEELDAILSLAVPHYAEKGTLDETPIQFELHAFSQPTTPLLFPGKVLADGESDRLYIADSNHNRIVISTLSGELVDVVGTGETGAEDGDYASAQFNQPQGMALSGDALIVADTENHLLRKIDLSSKTVTTIAGMGYQGRIAFPGLEDVGPFDELTDEWVGAPLETAINSPWAVFVREGDIYIAMAGPHQIWKLKADGSAIGPYAGSRIEDIIDGPLLPIDPFDFENLTLYSAFAQPSGLASDGEWLYVADSEGSSIRAVPFDPTMEVRTVVGTNNLAVNRLFEFGDVDGAREDVKLQHPLGVVYQDGQLYITDTYNNKVKRIDAVSGETQTLAGTGEPGFEDQPAMFDEPAGLSLANDTLFVADTNNHAIRTVDIGSGDVGTLEIKGLRPPARAERPQRREATDLPAGEVATTQVASRDGHVSLAVELRLPDGWKINELAPMSYTIEDETFEGIIDNSALADDATKLANPSKHFEIQLPVLSEVGTDEIIVRLNYYYCQEGGEGLCKVGGVQWKVAFEVSGEYDATPIALSFDVETQDGTGLDSGGESPLNSDDR